MTNEEFIQSIALPGEEWRDVVGYEGFYIVSNCGRIATAREMFPYIKNGKLFYKRMSQHVCSTSISPSTNYRRMTFTRDGIKSTQLVHRVVAEAFIPNPYNYPCIDHIDDNPENNHADNLQWCTYRINNSKPRHRMLGSSAKKGRVDPKRKPLVALKDGVVAKTYASLWDTLKDGHQASAIIRVIRGELKTHHGFAWMRLSDYESQVSMSKNSDTES